MKIAPHFRAFLELHQYLVLPRLGRFSLITGETQDIDRTLPSRWLKFSQESPKESDPAFIDFLSRVMKVETCIAAADLNYFCNTANEMLMQGFEAEIPGIGYLHMEPGNQLKFSVKSIYKNAIQKIRRKRSTFSHTSFWL